ncbi:MAG: YhcH/YjgK/YiaL family protein [Alloprevotella sp.]|nr:YhcH/YjgK/YiaL family protein [Alloprevotella sp.]
MILAKIEDAARYYSILPQLKALFEYLKENDLKVAPAGRIELDGNNLFINVSETQLRNKDEQKLEVHRAYVDVHFPLSCSEIIGIRHLDTLGESDAPFDLENDFALYSDKATNYFVVSPGEFCLVFPEDAHAPIIGNGPIKKLIAKIKL